MITNAGSPKAQPSHRLLTTTEPGESGEEQEPDHATEHHGTHAVNVRALASPEQLRDEAKHREIQRQNN